MDNKLNYIFHLLVWMLPVIIGQWFIAKKIFLKNIKAIILPTIIIGTYYSIVDTVAVFDGIWFFDSNQILGLHIGVLPLEEILFFYITSLLVSQTFIMLLPSNKIKS
ncbi:MAG: lycopene cyclase domain-containing protein [Chlorobiota bacterium]|nr:lycopene cyclase domain-containing protein [Chlorobiota bacterium]QQS66928.1 MAG: lycopene cyclase domain-containing protein [Chlorobiota bacterium]